MTLCGHGHPAALIPLRRPPWGAGRVFRAALGGRFTQSVTSAGSPGLPRPREQNPQGPRPSCPGLPQRAPPAGAKAAQLPSCCHLWVPRFWFPSAAASRPSHSQAHLCTPLCPAGGGFGDPSVTDWIAARVALQWLSLLDVHD